MSCELYDKLTDFSLLSGTGPSCVQERGCPQTPEKCRWGGLLRSVARNMALEDTTEDLEQDAELAKLEARAAILNDVKAKTDICLRRVN